MMNTGPWVCEECEAEGVGPGDIDHESRCTTVTVQALYNALLSILDSHAVPLYGWRKKERVVKGFTLYLPYERYKQAQEAISKAKEK